MDRCHLAIREKRYSEAHTECDAVLATGESWRFLVRKASLLDLEQHDAEALELLTRALRLAPHERSALRQRSAVRAAQGDINGAAQDKLIVRQLDATDDWLGKQVAWVLGKLHYEGDQLERAGKHQDAAKHFSLGTQLAPDDRDFLLRMGRSQAASALAADEVQAQLAAAPNNFELRKFHVASPAKLGTMCPVDSRILETDEA